MIQARELLSWHLIKYPVFIEPTEILRNNITRRLSVFNFSICTVHVKMLFVGTDRSITTKEKYFQITARVVYLINEISDP